MSIYAWKRCIKDPFAAQEGGGGDDPQRPTTLSEFLGLPRFSAVEEKSDYIIPFIRKSINFAFQSGYVRYELSNHLGNVLATITDRKLPRETEGDDDNGCTLFFDSDIASAQDYYPFGMCMPGRIYAPEAAGNFAGSKTYRYGFNGQDGDNDEAFGGVTDHYTAEFWEYDARIGRRFELDPVPQVSISDYAVNYNNPIMVSDPEGDTGGVTIDKENKTVTVKARMYFAGKASTKERAKAIAASIQDDWNYPDGTLTIEGVVYQVKFEVTGKSVSKLGLVIRKLFGGGNAVNNFITMDKEVGEKYDHSDKSNLSEYAVGGNDATFVWGSDKIVGREYAHEFGHGLAWFDILQRGAVAAGAHDYLGYEDLPNTPYSGIMTSHNASIYSSEGFYGDVDRKLYKGRKFENVEKEQEKLGVITPSLRRVNQKDIHLIGISTSELISKGRTKISGKYILKTYGSNNDFERYGPYIGDGGFSKL